MGEKRAFRSAGVGYACTGADEYCMHWYVSRTHIGAIVTCVGLVYSVIAPIIVVFSVICVGTLWALYGAYPLNCSRLNLARSSLFYPTAIRQLFTGIYFMELCLSGLFFLVRDAEGNSSCSPQGIIMIAVLAMTVLFHCSLSCDVQASCTGSSRPQNRIICRHAAYIILSEDDGILAHPGRPRSR